jgi:2'-5' RNA ligase
MSQTSLPGFEPPLREIHNLFFALWPDDATRIAIDTAVDRLTLAHPIGGRRIKAARLHMTLQFLGEHGRLPADLIASACAAAAEMRAAAFDLELDTVGSFGNRNIPCWLGSRQPSPALQALFDQLGEALRRHGCRVVDGSRFVPHLTVLRDAQRPLDLPLDAPIRWHVDEFVLIDSRTQPFAPYRLLGRCHLP